MVNLGIVIGVGEQSVSELENCLPVFRHADNDGNTNTVVAPTCK